MLRVVENPTSRASMPRSQGAYHKFLSMIEPSLDPRARTPTRLVEAVDALGDNAFQFPVNCETV
jgi:hypothetical protein